MAKEDILIIGLGRFGRALARELVELGHQVLGVDADAECVQAATRDLQHVVQADATSTEAMRDLGAADFKTAVVAIGSHIESSIIATYVLVDLGISRIWAKAITSSHGEILSRVGAHRVVFPERDMGIRVAHTHTRRTIDYIELDPTFALLESSVPSQFVGKSLRDTGIRGQLGLTVVCVKKPGGTFTYATPNTVLGRDDLLVVAGEPRRAEEFAGLE